MNVTSDPVPRLGIWDMAIGLSAPWVVHYLPGSSYFTFIFLLCYPSFQRRLGGSPLYLLVRTQDAWKEVPCG